MSFISSLESDLNKGFPSHDHIGYVFEEDDKGNPLFKSLSKDEIKDIYSSIESDLIPLFEEFQYTSGLEKVEKWKELLKENLE